MNRSRNKVQKLQETNTTDLSFPVSYSEQAKFLKLADDFLALETSSDDSNVIVIDRGGSTRTDRAKKTA
jgi:hypothetical protein